MVMERSGWELPKILVPVPAADVCPPLTAEPRKCVPSVVVGVVGMGHVPGIEKNWSTDLNIQEIMT
jgi:hypothetical protein